MGPLLADVGHQHYTVTQEEQDDMDAIMLAAFHGERLELFERTARRRYGALEASRYPGGPGPSNGAPSANLRIAA